MYPARVARNILLAFDRERFLFDLLIQVPNLSLSLGERVSRNKPEMTLV